MTLRPRHAFALALCAAVVLSDTVRNTRKRASLREQVFAASVWYTTAAAMRRGGPAPVDVGGGSVDYTNPETVFAEPVAPTVALNGTYDTFGNRVTRLTDATSTSAGSGMSNWYVDRSAFNLDSTRMIGLNPSAAWVIYPLTVTGSAGSETISSGTGVALPVGGGGQPTQASPGYWDNTIADRYWMADGYKLWRFQPSTAGWTMVRDFASEVAAKDMTPFENIISPWNGTAVLYIGGMSPDSDLFFFHLNKESKNSFGTLVYRVSTNTIVRFDVGVEMGSAALPAESPPTAVGTGSITGTVFTDSTHTSGTYKTGMKLTGTGIAAGTEIVSLGTGTGANNGGTYNVNISQTVASTAITGTDANRYNGGGMDRSGTYAMQQMAGTVGTTGWSVRQYVQTISSGSQMIGTAAATSRSASYTDNAAHGAALDSAIVMSGDPGWNQSGGGVPGGFKFFAGLIHYDFTTTYTGSGYTKRKPFAWWLFTNHDGLHLSVCPKRSDRFAYLTMYQQGSGTRITDQPLANELVVVDLQANATQAVAGGPVTGQSILRLGHHFTEAYRGYYFQGHATVSLDGKWLVFASSLGSNSRYDICAMRLPTAWRA